MVNIGEQQEQLLPEEVVGYTFYDSRYLSGYDGVPLHKSYKPPKGNSEYIANFDKTYPSSEYIRNRILVYKDKEDIPYYDRRNAILIRVPKNTPFYKGYKCIIVAKVIILPVNRLSMRLNKLLNK